MSGGDALRRFGAKVIAQQGRVVETAALVLVQEIISVLSTPGTGRIRRSGRQRKGAGTFKRILKGEGIQRGYVLTQNGGYALRRVTRGVAKTNIDLTNRASAAGDPPAPDTSALRGSAGYERIGLKARVGVAIGYGRHLEVAGTGRNAKRKARPFMKPALARARARMTDELTAALRVVK